MGCRCGERANAIRDAALAIARGDSQAVAEAARFVARTSAEDLKHGAQALKIKAAARLGLKR